MTCTEALINDLFFLPSCFCFSSQLQNWQSSHFNLFFIISLSHLHFPSDSLHLSHLQLLRCISAALWLCNFIPHFCAKYSFWSPVFLNSNLKTRNMKKDCGRWFWPRVWTLLFLHELALERLPGPAWNLLRVSDLLFSQLFQKWQITTPNRWRRESRNEGSWSKGGRKRRGKEKKTWSVYKSGELITENWAGPLSESPPEIGCYYSQALSDSHLTANNSQGSDAVLQSWESFEMKISFQHRHTAEAPPSVVSGLNTSWIQLSVRRRLCNRKNRNSWWSHRARAGTTPATCFY